MKVFILSLAIFSLFSVIYSEELNYRPIIGIYDAPSAFEEYPRGQYTFLSATNVKWLESSGARVVPIHSNGDSDYYDWIFARINGILFPGGGEAFDHDGVPTQFAQNVNYLVRKAMNATDNGDYFPLYGICLGFESIQFAITGYNTSYRRYIADEEDVQRTTQFIDNVQQESRLYANVSDELLTAAKEETISYYYHAWQIQDSDYDGNPALNETFKILSHGQNPQGDVYVDAIEGRNYPFYAHQFHPEKNLFEWALNIPHSLHAIEWSHYHGEFFVQEARKNFHKFDDEEQEQQNLIYQYTPHYFMNEQTQDYFFRCRDQ